MARTVVNMVLEPLWSLGSSPSEGKRCAATLFFDYRRQHILPIKVVRLFNTYGPRIH